MFRPRHCSYPRYDQMVTGYGTWWSFGSISDPNSWKPGLGSVRYRCCYEDGSPAGSTKEHSPTALANQAEGGICVVQGVLVGLSAISDGYP